MGVASGVVNSNREWESRNEVANVGREKRSREKVGRECESRKLVANVSRESGS